MAPKRQDEVYDPTDPYAEESLDLDDLLEAIRSLRSGPIRQPRGKPAPPTPPPPAEALTRPLYDRRKGPQDRRSAPRPPSGM